MCAMPVRPCSTKKKIGRLEVPQSFPLGFADDLRARGFEVTTVPDPFFPSRVRKSDREIDLIRRVLRSTEYAMKVAADVLREARVGGKKGNDLFLGSERLTSERLRFLIHRALLEKQCTAQHTIVAGGRQGYDPHQVGTGPLRAGQPIIVDIFPRSDVTGYHGDMTRTFVKGRATERVRRMYSAVRAAQDYAFANLGPAVQAHVVNQGVKQVFRDQGFPEERKGGANVGFIHNTGHGLGLDVHEQPSISDRPCRLAPGHVLTVEPGLYYPDVGGVRIEDVVCITEEGITKLTRMETAPGNSVMCKETWPRGPGFHYRTTGDAIMPSIAMGRRLAALPKPVASVTSALRLTWSPEHLARSARFSTLEDVVAATAEPSDRCVVLFCRHGQTNWARQGLATGWRDEPLNEQGLRQSRTLSRAVRDLNVKRVYTSPSPKEH